MIYLSSSKRSAIGPSMSDMWGIYIFIFLVVVFSILFSITSSNKQEVKIEGISTGENIDLLMANYLKTPISTFIDGQKITMPVWEFIVLMHVKGGDVNDMIDELKKVTNSSFNPKTNTVGIKLITESPRSDKVTANRKISFIVDPDERDKNFNGNTLVKEYARSCTEIFNPIKPDTPISVQLVLVNANRYNDNGNTRNEFLRTVSCK